MISNAARPMLGAAFAIILNFPGSSLSASIGSDSVQNSTLNSGTKGDSITPPSGAGRDSAGVRTLSTKDVSSPASLSAADSSTTAPPPAINDTARKAVSGRKSFWEIAGNDTILVLTTKTVQDFMKGLPFRRHGARERGYGGGIGFSPGLYWLDLEPIRSLVNKVDELNYIGFDLGDGRSIISLPGGILYGGLGNGIRIGFEGRGGAKSISQDIRDTTFFLNIGMGYGGLLIEKAFVSKDINFMVGGMAGAGGIGVTLNHEVGKSGFSAIETDVEEPDGSAAAFIMIMQLHAACTYSLLPWVHIGVECAAPAFISPGGFMGMNGRSITDGFTTFNLGVQLRLVLGNLG